MNGLMIGGFVTGLAMCLTLRWCWILRRQLKAAKHEAAECRAIVHAVDEKAKKEVETHLEFERRHSARNAELTAEIELLNRKRAADQQLIRHLEATRDRALASMNGSKNAVVGKIMDELDRIGGGTQG